MPLSIGGGRVHNKPMKRLFLVVLGAAVAAFPQAMVEYSLGTANSTAGASASKRAGKAAARVFEKAAKTPGRAAARGRGRSSPALIVLPPAPAAENEKPVKFTAPDPAQVRVGMTAEELVAKFGEPAAKVTGSENGAESWWYGTGAEELTLKLLGGKVTAVIPPPKPAAAKAPAKTDPVVVVLP
jgi:hypothetical protein